MLRELLDVDDTSLGRGALEIVCNRGNCRKYVLEGTSPGGVIEKRWIISRLMEYAALLEKAAEHATLFIMVEADRLTLAANTEYLSFVFSWSDNNLKTLWITVEVFKVREDRKKMRPLLMIMPPDRVKASRIMYTNTSLDSTLRLFKRFVKKFILPGRREKQKTILV